MRIRLSALIVCLAVSAATPTLAADTPDPLTTPWPGFAGSFLVAHSAEMHGDWQQAEASFADVAARDPYNLEFLHRQTVLLLNQGRFDEALKLARLIGNQSEGTHLARLLIFADAADHNDTAAARAMLSQMSDDGLGQYIKPFFTAWLADNFTDAQKALRPVAAMPSLAGMAQLHTALLAARFGDINAARQAFSRVIAGSPSYRAVALAASFYAENNMPERREALLKAALDAGVEASLVDRLRARGSGDRVDDLRTGIAETIFGLAGLLQTEGASDIALPYLRIVTSLRPDLGLANLMAGDLMLRLGKYDEARALYKMEAEAQDVGPLATLRLAALEIELDGPISARTRLEALVKTAPDWSEAWAHLGDAAGAAGDLSAALANYNRAIDLAGATAGNDSRARLLFSRGMINHRLRDNAAAERDLESSIKLVSDNAERLNYLGYMWADRGVRLTEAEVMVSRAMALEPNNPNIIDSLGWIKFRAGNMAEAVRLLELASELMPYNSVVNDHLGDAYWATGRLTEARFQWRRAISYRDTGDTTLTSVEDLRLKLERGIALRLTAERQ